jgi:hypothetical protein
VKRPAVVSFAFLATVIAYTVQVSAAEPLNAASRILPDDAVARLEVDGIEQLVSHPLVARIADWTTQTRFLDGYWERPDVQAFYDALTLFESRIGQTRYELLTKLTGSGLAAAFVPGPPPRVVIVADSVDEALPSRLLQVVDEVVDELAATGGNSGVEKAVYQDYQYRKLGGLHVAIKGARLLLSGDRDTLKSVVDRLPPDADPGKAAADSEQFRIRLTANVKTLRAAPDMQKGLEFPATDVGAVAILGGWTDLLRSFDQATVELSGTNGEIHIRAAMSDPKGPKVSPGLEGFWAQQGQAPLRLLSPPGTIYSTSWYRDYSAMWDAREKLVAGDLGANLAKADADAGVQMQVVGAAFTPSQMITQLGPHFRVVLLEGSAPYSEIAPPNVIPAGVAVVELKDEALVRKWSGPVLRILNLILNGDQGIISTTEKYGDADLATLSLPSTAQALRKGSLDRFNFRTTYTFAHGSFVIGSTPAAVKAVLDDLSQDSKDTEAIDGIVTTERQLLDAGRANAVLESVQESVLRGFVLQAGLSTDDAREELDRLRRLFDGLGVLKAHAGLNDAGFEYRIDWTMPAMESNLAADRLAE